MHRRTFLCLGVGAATTLVGRRGYAENTSRQKIYDLVIYGGSCAAVTTAVQATRMGKMAVIVNPYSFLGGMTSAGLSSIDTVLDSPITGITGELLKRFGGELVEPHVAQRAFDAIIADSNVQVFHDERLDLTRGVQLSGTRIDSIKTESGRTFLGKMFIDASYEGDLMARAGVRYIIGRESNAQYGETLNGFQRAMHGHVDRLSDNGEEDRFIKDVDPYVVRGNPASGMLPRINTSLKQNGQGDSLVQAYNYRLTLSDDPDNQIPFEKPEGYRELDHELLLRNFEAGDDRLPARLATIPNRKYDWNSFSAIGTDMAGANAGYADGTHRKRIEIDRLHEHYTRGHFWTLAHHSRVPQKIREAMRHLGYAKDEFKRNNGFPNMLYLREGRRMVGGVVMTEHHCMHRAAVEDPIVLASFPMDSHVVQYVVNERGFVEREGVFFKECSGPYGLSYRAIVPRQKECSNLLVPICLSATHVAYGSIRMEPTYMSLGQVCATAASLAIDGGTSVQQLSYQKLRERLESDQMIVVA
jgi:hypothetical protein